MWLVVRLYHSSCAFFFNMVFEVVSHHNIALLTTCILSVHCALFSPGFSHFLLFMRPGILFPFIPSINVLDRCFSWSFSVCKETDQEWCIDVFIWSKTHTHIYIYICMYAHLYMYFLHLLNIVFLSLLPLNGYMNTTYGRSTLDIFKRWSYSWSLSSK